MNPDWNCTIWALVWRIVWLAIVLACLAAGIRLMAWADTGSRKLDSNEVAPSERAKDINYGPIL